MPSFGKFGNFGIPSASFVPWKTVFIIFILLFPHLTSLYITSQNRDGQSEGSGFPPGPPRRVMGCSEDVAVNPPGHVKDGLLMPRRDAHAVEGRGVVDPDQAPPWPGTAAGRQLRVRPAKFHPLHLPIVVKRADLLVGLPEVPHPARAVVRPGGDCPVGAVQSDHLFLVPLETAHQLGRPQVVDSHRSVK